MIGRSKLYMKQTEFKRTKEFVDNKHLKVLTLISLIRRRPIERIEF